MKKPERSRVKTRILARKAPVQSRSRQTVADILRATARIFVKEGFKRATTNRIAEVAGVSIGTLYQYFPSKEAIIRSLHAEHIAKLRAKMVPDASLEGQPLEVVLRSLVTAVIAAHAIDPPLHAQLMQAGASLGISPTEALYEAALSLAKSLMSAYAPSLRALDPEISPFIVVCAVDAIIHQSSREHPEFLTQPKLVDEVTHLLKQYVLR